MARRAAPEGVIIADVAAAAVRKKISVENGISKDNKTSTQRLIFSSLQMALCCCLKSTDVLAILILAATVLWLG